MKKEVPIDGYDAFYEGFDINDNPYPEWDGRRDEWEDEYCEAAKNYKEEGRFQDGSFKG